MKLSRPARAHLRRAVMTTGNVEATERYLIATAKALRARGLKLIYGLAEVQDRRGKVVGCCITHAQDNLRRGEAEKFGTMHLPDGDVFDLAWDAIEAGFDGEPRAIPRDMLDDYGSWLSGEWPFEWWYLGRRLHQRLQPGCADRLVSILRRAGNLHGSHS